MGRHPRTALFKHVLIIGILSTALLGCDYISFYTRQSTWHAVFENKPRMSMLNQYAPEHSLLLDGRISRLQRERGPLLLVVVSSQYKPNEIVALSTLREPPDDYTLFLPKGDYGLFVFADLNRNGYFERDELVGQASVLVDSGRSKDGEIVEGPTIPVDYEQPGKTVFRIRVKVRATSYIYASLDDEFFDPQFGNKGLYNPASLMAHTQGFVFGLEEYDEKKTAVLFIHGNSGTPRDWKFFAEGLDRSRFQPFFLYYPSGLPIDKLGSLLAQVLSSHGKDANYLHRRKIVLVAHSLGGLVAMSAINKLAAEGLPPSLKMYISFSTPYGGDDTARKWINAAPAVVPMWRDIAAGSEFLQGLAHQQFPKTVPFYLFFTYNDQSAFRPGESSDGIVTLRSQLTPSAQTAAVKVFGFNETHESVLSSEVARQAFYKLLDTVTPQRNEEEARQ